jgi:hypothetical protein
MKTRRLLLPLVVVALALPLLVCAQNKPARGNAEATVNGKKVSINYGRPALNGRDILAQAPVGTVWRVGMNEATEITSAGDLLVGGTTLKAGKYSLWVRRTGDDTWTLAFHPKTGIWGKPEQREGYVAELPLKLDKATDSAEQLVIDLADKGNGNAGISIHWGTAMLTGTFGVK